MVTLLNCLGPPYPWHLEVSELLCEDKVFGACGLYDVPSFPH